jgi:hypothetical protein
LASALRAVGHRRNLNPLRRDRTYPRVIKRSRHNGYREKRPSDKGIRHNGPPEVRLLAAPGTPIPSN